MAAAQAPATLTHLSSGIIPVRRALHAEMVAMPSALARYAAMQPDMLQTGPELEAIYYDPRGITKTRQRGTVAHRFLSVNDGRPKPFDLLLSSDQAQGMQFGGAYRLAVDYGDEDSVPLVIRAPEYISKERTVTPSRIRFCMNSKGLEITLSDSNRTIDFARGDEAAKMLAAVGAPKGGWRVSSSPMEKHIKLLEGVESVTIHSVVTRPGGKWHAMGLPSVQGGQYMVSPVAAPTRH